MAEQQKEQRAPKLKNRILKKTHDIKLAEALSPITKKLHEVKESTQDFGEVIKKSQPETPQLAIENTPTTHKHIENNEGKKYDVELENTIQNMRANTGFFKTHFNRERG